MRIAYVCADPGVPVFGHKGCSVHVKEMLRALSRQGARLELFAACADGEPVADLGVHPLQPLPTGNRALREQAALAANEEVRSLLERCGPFDAVYERYSLWSFSAMEFARDTGIPGLLEVNAPLVEEQARYRELVDEAGAKLVAKRAFASASALIAVSSAVADYVRRCIEANGHLHVIPNGVDPDRVRPGLERALAREHGTFTVGFVGSLKRWHGLSTLVEAFSALHRDFPQVRLLIVGDGPERERLVADVTKHRLEQVVHLTGAVASDRVPRMLASMDVAVAPYPDVPDFYFSPVKVFEYMAAGLPVVASRLGQLPEIIQSEVNGLLVPPGDAEALTAALRRLISERQLGSRLGAKARETVVRNHTWDLAARRVLEIAGLGFEARPDAERVGN
jgi:glycosyltransferase involved in cell wall biosynthesis